MPAPAENQWLDMKRRQDASGGRLDPSYHQYERSVERFKSVVKWSRGAASE
jgi:hypothetical protein